MQIIVVDLKPFMWAKINVNRKFNHKDTVLINNNIKKRLNKNPMGKLMSENN